MPWPFTLPFTHLFAASGLALHWLPVPPSGAAQSLNLAACPSAGHGEHMPRHLSTYHHQVGRAPFGAQRRETALPRPTSIRQNIWKSNQGSVVMQWPSIKPNAQVGVFSTPAPTLRRLTGRSSGHQQGPRLRHCLGPCWCPAHLRCSGAAYLGR